MKAGADPKSTRCPLQGGDDAAILLDYCARRLSPEAAAVLERHMAVCPECREFADSQREVWRALDEWEPESPSSSFGYRLSDEIEFQRGRAIWRRRLGDWFEGISWKPALPAAAIVALWAVLVSPPTGGGRIESQPQMERQDAEQVELELQDLDMLEQLRFQVQ